ncbi:MAG: hypothetical protein IK026_04335 [Eubacteriaceae bacterium]|nr:hypothetical protein [Eubacteriaceae bacterium]MBR5995790.1 hypothetical protein [Eubacteriaceae bacterium]
MNRLTKRDEAGKTVYSDDISGRIEEREQAVLDSLAAYEDTGCTPEQVEQEMVYAAFFTDHNLTALKTKAQLARWAEQIARNNTLLKKVNAELDEYRKKENKGPCDICSSRSELRERYGDKAGEFAFCPKCGRSLEGLPDDEITQGDLKDITSNISKLLDQISAADSRTK